MTKLVKEKLKNAIHSSRARILIDNPVYALLLMCLKVVADNSIKTVSVNQNCIFINPTFFAKLNSREVDFVLLHLLYHIINGDIWRDKYYKGLNYHHACDMINNKQLLNDGNAEERYSHLGKLFTLWNDWDYINAKPIDVYYHLFYSLESLTEQERKKIMFDTDEKWDDYYDYGQFGELIIDSEKDIDERFFAKATTVISEKGEESEDNENTYAESLSNNIRKQWEIRIDNAFNTVKKTGGKGCGFEENYENLQINKLKKSQTDWKTILQEALSSEVCDYSFLPVDKRYNDSDFFLPDFNEFDTTVKNVFFMVDTSASVGTKELTAAFSEIQGAMSQFKGKLCGKLCFFDIDVRKAVDFDGVTDIEKIKPIGGGGTCFFNALEYVANLENEDVSQIIILTDGEAIYPEESIAKGIPVLWLINNEEETPPWGKIARIKV